MSYCNPRHESYHKSLMRLVARGTPSTKLPRGRLLSRCFVIIAAHIITEAAAFLQMNCRSRCISPDELQKLLRVKKWTHTNTTCTRKHTCEVELELHQNLSSEALLTSKMIPIEMENVYENHENKKIFYIFYEYRDQNFIYTPIFRCYFSILRSYKYDLHIVLGIR